MEALGIPDIEFKYVKVNDCGDKIKEFIGIRNFLEKAVNSDIFQEFQGNTKMIQFINYGDTQLVYVLTVGDKKYAMLVGQPITEFGAVKKEYDNLKAIGKNNKENVVVPIHYFKDDDQKRELYIAPYLYQARCIGTDMGQLGAWVPEPRYHFRFCSDEERSIINSSMIAMLVKFYDDKKNLGISSCHLGGGDFVLEKGYEDEPITYENILKRMKLIAARELIHIDFEEYVKRLKDEFSQVTYYSSEKERDKSILINHKSRVAMSIEDIERGIEIGCELRQKQKDKEQNEKMDRTYE